MDWLDEQLSSQKLSAAENVAMQKRKKQGASVLVSRHFTIFGFKFPYLESKAKDMSAL